MPPGTRYRTSTHRVPVGVVGALSAFYHDSLDINDPHHREISAVRLVAKRGLVKVLARGELTKTLTVKAHGFSGAARSAIEAAGGRVEVLPAPWGDRRPPAGSNNALTNR